MTRVLLLTVVSLNAWAGLRAGAAIADITPPVGSPMGGYFYNRAATAVHDPLLARAIVFENQGTRIALISCDLTNMPEGIARQTRQLVATQTGIPASHIMVTATHAHTAPVLLSGWTRYALDGEMKRLAEAYTAALPGRIASSVSQANDRLRPARILATIGQQPALAFNRRFHMQDGTVGWNPGKRNANILKPAGPIDPSVPLIFVEGEDGRAIAAYVNYAMHLDTIGTTEFSADLVYSLSEALKLARGQQIVTLFTMGCAGNINHIDVSTPHKQNGHGEAARIGTTLAASVLNAIDRLEPLEDHTLSAQQSTVRLDPVLPTVEEQRQAHSLPLQPGSTLHLARAARTLHLEAQANQPFEAEVQALRVGKDLVWVGLPAEVFVELGLDLKRRSSTRYTVIATQTNGALGYIPNQAAYPQGNYEVVSARVVPGSGEKLVDKALQLIGAGKHK